MKKLTIIILSTILLAALSGCQKNVIKYEKAENKYSNLPVCTSEEDERDGNYFDWIELANKLTLDNPTQSDYQKSLCLYKKTLKVKDIPEPKYNIGMMYFKGQGVEKDLQQARQWFLEADSSEQGFPPASFALGTMYFDGKGEKQDYQQAMKWFEKAGVYSARDHRYTSENAYLLLGQMHYHGMGTAKNNKTAFAYFWLSSRLGNEDAKHDLDIITKKLSKAQLNNAMKITNQLNEKYHVLLSNPFPAIK